MEIGKARTVTSGTDLTIITYGLGVHWATETMSHYPEISAEIVDLRSLMPLDKEAIFQAANKTGKVIVLHEDCLTGGIGGELVALITEHCFEQLDAPVLRVASMDTPVPFAVSLEKQFLASERLKEAIDRIMKY